MIASAAKAAHNERAALVQHPQHLGGNNVVKSRRQQEQFA